MLAQRLLKTGKLGGVYLTGCFRDPLLYLLKNYAALFDQTFKVKSFEFVFAKSSTVLLLE